jgi:hypothetical protein
MRGQLTTLSGSFGAGQDLKTKPIVIKISEVAVHGR